MSAAAHGRELQAQVLAGWRNEANPERPRRIPDLDEHRGDYPVSLYEADFYAWTQHTAGQLRRGEFSALDIAELVEEVIDMGNWYRDQLESRLTILIAHMLKRDFQPDKRSSSWRATIRLQRNRILRLLKRMPSLGSAPQEALLEAYEDATALAIEETTLPKSTFPASLPYTIDEILSREY